MCCFSLLVSSKWHFPWIYVATFPLNTTNLFSSLPCTEFKLLPLVISFCFVEFFRRDHCHTMTSCDFNHWTYILHRSTDDDTFQCQPLNTHTGPLLSKVHGLQMVIIVPEIAISVCYFDYRVEKRCLLFCW